MASVVGARSSRRSPGAPLRGCGWRAKNIHGPLFDHVAQLAEHLAFNQVVAGSMPAVVTRTRPGASRKECDSCNRLRSPWSGPDLAPWSSDKDGALSRRRPGFDSRRGHQ